MVDLRARALIEQPIGELTTGDEYQAIVEALESDVMLTKVIDISGSSPRFGEGEFRVFLRHLLERSTTRRQASLARARAP